MTLRAWTRPLLWSLAGLALLALLAWAMRPAPVPVSVARVNAAPFVDSVIEEGRTRLRDTWNVSAPIAGYLQRVVLEVGDEVEQGHPLFLLEPSPAPALDPRSRQQAEETLQAAEARLRTARTIWRPLVPSAASPRPSSNATAPCICEIWSPPPTWTSVAASATASAPSRAVPPPASRRHASRWRAPERCWR